MKLKWQWTVPNVLSICRIVIVPIFAVLYLLSARYPSLLWWSIGLLVASGLTDMFDGIIARACNQITEIGKVLDPLADKLTQITVLICIAIRMPQLWPLVAVCFCKELLQVIGASLMLLRGKGRVHAAKWYGKISTFAFYAVMAMHVLFPTSGDALWLGWNMPVPLSVTLLIIVAILMIFSFAQYARIFVQVTKEETPVKGEHEV